MNRCFKSCTIVFFTALLVSCGSSEITHYDKIENIVRRANQLSEEAESALQPALKLLKTGDERMIDQQLKTVIIRKNKEWSDKDWFALSWRRMGTGLQSYKNFPFHTYKDFVDQYISRLKRFWQQLNRIKVVDVSSTRNKIDLLIKKLTELNEIIEAHDRYLQETDKMGLIMTRSQSSYAPLFGPGVRDIK